MFNPKPKIQAVPLFDEQVCYVIDDVLLHPEAWVQEAINHREHFIEAPSNAYPGIELPMPDYMTQALQAYLRPLLKQHFGVRRILNANSRLSMVTRKPEQLLPRQWICHRDRLKIEPGQMAIASVLYLFKNPELGGTQFFSSKQAPLATDILVHDSSVMAAEEFSLKYAIKPGYICASNAYFEKTCTVPAKWNRMIVYSGMVFHSGDIQHPEAMTNDPQTGRLSLNGFFSGKLSVS